MLLGKRPRPPIMKRTRSMSGGMAVDMQVSSNMEAHEEVVMSDSLHLQDEEDGIKEPHAVALGPDHGLVADQTKNVFGAKGYEYDERFVDMVLPPSPTTTNNHLQNQTSNPDHVIYTPHFLRTCGLCKCRLAPGRDIYMYRGDTAFCSSECRAKQIKQDQRKEKCKVASDKEDHRAPPPTATAKASTKSETAACS